MFRSLVACVAVLAFAQAVPGQDIPEEEQLFSRLSDKTLEKLLADVKLPFERKEETVKKKVHVTYHVTFKGGFKATLINHGTWLSLWSYGLKTANKEDISLERANEWNLKNATCKAHVSDLGSGILTSNLTILYGTNHKIIRGWLLDYAVVFPRFIEFTN